MVLQCSSNRQAIYVSHRNIFNAMWVHTKNSMCHPATLHHVCITVYISATYFYIDNNGAMPMYKIVESVIAVVDRAVHMVLYLPQTQPSGLPPCIYQYTTYLSQAYIICTKTRYIPGQSIYLKDMFNSGFLIDTPHILWY